MELFIQKFIQLSKKSGKVLLEHCLFDKQSFYCDAFNIINDDRKIGLILNNQEIFMDKQDIKFVKMFDNTYVMSDGRLTVTIIVNKM